MKKKKKNNVIRGIFIFLFITYMTLYISQKSGYLDLQNYKKKEFTEEKKKQFENDLKNGKKVNIEDYKYNEVKNYSNRLSNIGYKSSNGISKLVSSGVDSFFKTLAKLAEDE